MALNLLNQIKRSINLKKISTAGKNANFFRLAYQAIPYFLLKNGYSFPPLSVFIHVNNWCNLRCTFCDIWMEDKGSFLAKNLGGAETRNMEIENFKKIIDKVKSFRPLIGIPAAEPLLYKDLHEAISYIKFNGLDCSVTTNATTLESRAEELVDSGLDKLGISIDGPARIHDVIRDSSGAYYKAISGLKKLDEIKKSRNSRYPEVSIVYTISEANHNVLPEFLDSFPLELVETIMFRTMLFLTEEAAKKHNKSFGEKYDAMNGSCLNGGVNLLNIDTDLLFEQMNYITERYKEKISFRFRWPTKQGLRTYFHDHDTFMDNTPCVYPWYTMQINTDGSAQANQRCFHQIFGNLLEQDFQEVWNGEKLKTFRKDLLVQKNGRFEACSRCDGVLS